MHETARYVGSQHEARRCAIETRFTACCSLASIEADVKGKGGAETVKRPMYAMRKIQIIDGYNRET